MTSPEARSDSWVRPRPYRLSPIGWGDVVLPARLNYQRFVRVVERAQREVLLEFPGMEAIHVLVESAEGTDNEVWGEYYPPSGPIVIYQKAYEVMEDEHNYYRQIKEVLRHEYRHAIGKGDHEMPLAQIRRGEPASLPYRLSMGGITVTFP